MALCEVKLSMCASLAARSCSLLFGKAPKETQCQLSSFFLHSTSLMTFCLSFSAKPTDSLAPFSVGSGHSNRRWHSLAEPQESIVPEANLHELPDPFRGLKDTSLREQQSNSGTRSGSRPLLCNRQHPGLERPPFQPLSIWPSSDRPRAHTEPPQWEHCLMSSRCFLAHPWCNQGCSGGELVRADLRCCGWRCLPRNGHR